MATSHFQGAYVCLEMGHDQQCGRRGIRGCPQEAGRSNAPWPTTTLVVHGVATQRLGSGPGTRVPTKGFLERSRFLNAPGLWGEPSQAHTLGGCPGPGGPSMLRVTQHQHHLSRGEAGLRPHPNARLGSAF